MKKSKKTMSQKQIEANRRNGAKSRGPKTEEGRASSKFNAVKHGIFASQLVVRGWKINESASEFEQYCSELYDDLAPSGALQELLAQQIIAIGWRLRRVRRAEAGEIALSVDGGCWQRQEAGWQSSSASVRWGNAMKTVEELMVSSGGIDILIWRLDEVRKRVEQEGELSKTAADPVRIGHSTNIFLAALEEHQNWLAQNPENLDLETLRRKHREKVYDYIDRELARLRADREEAIQRETVIEQSHQAAELLPAPDKLDRILRYEAALERQLHRAIRQLEHLQAGRRDSGGSRQPSPPPPAPCASVASTSGGHRPARDGQSPINTANSPAASASSPAVASTPPVSHSPAQPTFLVPAPGAASPPSDGSRHGAPFLQNEPKLKTEQHV